MLLKILAYAAILIWGWIAIAQVIVWARKAKRTEGVVWEPKAPTQR